jgi:hypothetical protein
LNAVQQTRAIAWLTWKAAFRFKLFLVVAVLLLVAVAGLPLLIKDDGTARGFTQILLTYTLSAITGLLGLSTLWLACGTLARDIEECQIQVVTVKPIARWQIWVGKWLGIVFLNAALLGISGASVFCLLQWRATRLPAEEQKILRNEVLVSRGSAKPPSMDADIDAETDRQLKERLEKSGGAKVDVAEVRKQIREQVMAEVQVVPPGFAHIWEVDLGPGVSSLRGQPIFLRLKFNAADKSPSGTFEGVVGVGVPRKTSVYQSELMHLAPDTFHELPLPADLFEENGRLTIRFGNLSNTALLFPLVDGCEVLYREGGFALNYARGLGVIFCWMALLAAIGLAAASFLSFPVAAFFAMCVLLLCFSTGLMANSVTEGTIGGYNAEKGPSGKLPVDVVAIPVFKGVLAVIGLAKDFSPVDSLSSGRSISWEQLARAFGQIVLLLGGAVALLGIAVFNRRELATAQGTQ